MKQSHLTRPPKILIVDDDVQTTRTLRTALSTQGYSVQVVVDGREGIALAHSLCPDLVIADIAMPGMNGIEFCRQLRKMPEVPILVLSSVGDELTRVEALEAGADDYMTKPFSIHELFARVRAKFRRRCYNNSSDSEVVAVGDFCINAIEHRVTVRNQAVHLTPLQFNLLLFFARHVDQVLAHRVILQNVWGLDDDRPEYIRVHIGQLRKRIEISDKPQYIVTEPWIGYRFRAMG